MKKIIKKYYILLVMPIICFIVDNLAIILLYGNEITCVNWGNWDITNGWVDGNFEEMFLIRMTICFFINLVLCSFMLNLKFKFRENKKFNIITLIVMLLLLIVIDAKYVIRIQEVF